MRWFMSCEGKDCVRMCFVLFYVLNMVSFLFNFSKHPHTITVEGLNELYGFKIKRDRQPLEVEWNFHKF